METGVWIDEGWDKRGQEETLKRFFSVENGG